MNKYEVLIPFLHPKSKLRINAGETIELNSAQAQTLLSQGRVKLVEKKTTTKAKEK